MKPDDIPSEISSQSTGNSDGQSQSSSFSHSSRQYVGQLLANVSDTINQNLITARYATIVSVAALTVWGISTSPLFFRFRRISDIPKAYFLQRKRITCRIVQIATSPSTLLKSELEAPVILIVRHLSPVTRFMPLILYEYFYPKPGHGFYVDIHQIPKDTIPVELAGIQAPIHSSMQLPKSIPYNVLENMVRNQTLVHLTLIAKRVGQRQLDLYPHDSSSSNYRQKVDTTYTTWESSSSSSSNSTTHTIDISSPKLNQHIQIPMTIIGQIHRPKVFTLSWLGQEDVGSLLVQYGLAHVLTSGLVHVHIPPFPTLHKSTNLHHIEKDARYLERLGAFEYKAIQKSIGIWSIDSVRQLKPEVLEEVEFQSKATMLQKMWRRIKERVLFN